MNDDYAKRYGFVTKVDYDRIISDLDEASIIEISKDKNEPEWMLEKRLLGLKVFNSKPLPSWGPDLSKINFKEIKYYAKPKASKTNDWDMLPKEMKETFEKLGIPESERKFFAGVETQFDSSVVYTKIRDDLKKIGVIFTDTDTAVREYPDLVKKYFATVVPPNDNKFAALNTAVWSGGSFIYVPKGVKVSIPLNAYFRINAERIGQFERTLIIADEGAEVTYIEGCTAPMYDTTSLHAAVVEIIAHKNAHVKYVTIQNWSKNIYNLVTQRAIAYENATVEWIDTNIGSKVNMKYPSIYLKGENSKGSILSIAFASSGQIQDSGGKVFHLAPNTSSTIVSKSIVNANGLSNFRGLIHIGKEAYKAKAYSQCDSLLLDETANTNTYPYLVVERNDVNISHEAKVGKIDKEKLFYLMSKGIDETTAKTLIILGFIEDLTKTIPMEYSLELKRLIELDLSSNKKVG